MKQVKKTTKEVPDFVFFLFPYSTITGGTGSELHFGFYSGPVSFSSSFGFNYSFLLWIFFSFFQPVQIVRDLNAKSDVNFFGPFCFGEKKTEFQARKKMRWALTHTHTQK